MFESTPAPNIAQPPARAPRPPADPYRALVEQSVDAIYVLQAGRYVLVNRAWEQLFGYTRAEALADNFHFMRLVAPESEAHLLDRVQRREAGRPVPPTYEFVALTKDGRRRTIEVRVVEITWQGRPALQGIYRDVTEGKRTEAALRASRTRYQSVVDSVQEVIFQTDPRGRWTFLNPAFTRITSFSIEEALGRSCFDYIHAEDRPRLIQTFRALTKQEREDGYLEARYLTNDGSYRWVAIHARILFGEDGRVDGVAGTFADVTERKVAETALHESQALLSSLSSNISDGIYRSTPEEGLIYVNDAFARMFGYTSAEEILRVPPQRFYADPRRRDELKAQVARDGRISHEEVEFLRRDGSTFWGLLSFAAIPDEDGRVRFYDGAVTDITEMKRAEEALRLSEERWRRLVESNPEGILITVGPRIVYLNEAGARAFGGATVEEVQGRLVTDFVEDETLRETLRERRAALDRGEATPPLEQRVYGLDGQARWLEAFSIPIMYQGRRAAQTVVRDVTERRRYEDGLIEAKERAEEMNRLKSTFLANMSHEIRTPLTSIIGFADVLAENASPAEREFAQLIRDSGERLMETLNSVLDLAQLEGRTLRLVPEPLNLAARAQKILDIFQVQAQKKGLTLALEAPAEAVYARLDPAAFSRILTNLVSNALKFTSEGGVLVEITADEAHGYLRVCDTGIGIGAAFLPHLFEEFRQESSGLARDFPGNGLGLTITRRLVEMMDGTIEVASEKGHGSTFTVRFPRLALAPVEASGKA